jgi:hypothetical protein
MMVASGESEEVNVSDEEGELDENEEAIRQR